MADLAINLQDQIQELNALNVSSPQEAIKILEQINFLKGKLIRGSVLEKSIENYLGKMDVYGIDGVIEALKGIETEAGSEFNTSEVPTAKINELVDSYDEYTNGKGYDDKMAIDKIYKDNKGTISQKNIENFLQKQRDLYKKTLDELNSKKAEEVAQEVKTPEEKIVDLNEYKNKKEEENNNKVEVEKKAERISRERFKIQNEIKEDLEIPEEKAEEIVDKVVAEIIEPNYGSKLEDVDQQVEKMLEKLPIELVNKEEKKILKEEIVEKVETYQSEIVIEEKSVEVADELIEKFKSDDRLKEVVIRNEEVLREEIKDAVKNSIIEESNLSEEIGNIFSEEKIEQINPELLTGVETEIKITEVKLNNWSNLNQKSVDQFRGEEITNRIELEILKENPNLSPDQLKQVKEYKKLIKQVYFSENSINKDRNEIFDSVSGEFSPGQIKNAWTDTKGLTKLVKMDSKKFKLFSEKYEKIKKSLGDIKLPFNIKECRSFEGLMTMIKGSKLFTRAQKFVGFVNRIANFRTEFMTRIGLKIGNFLIEKIGNQALKSFAQNSLQIIAKNGLEKGFSLILKGILSGGAKAGASAAAGAAGATGAAAASATVPVAGWVVAAVILAAQAVMFIGKKIGQALENMGLSLGIKSFLKDTFGGFLGGALNLALKLAMVIVGLPILLGTIAIGILITPIVIGLMAFSFISQIFTNSQVSSLVPPQTSNTQQTSNTNFTGANEDVNYTNDTGGSLKLDFIKELPPPKTNKRSDLVKTATAIVGVPYYWGGGHGWVVPNHREPSFGIDPNWGSKKVPVDNHAGHGMNRYYYGLDCSGFVSWVYYQTTGVNILSGATAIYNRSTKISADELLPGDIGIACPGGCGGDPTSNHVGIYVGKDKNGRNLFVNSGGSSSHGGPQGFGGVVIDHYPFKGFGRINQGGIQLINDL